MLETRKKKWNALAIPTAAIAAAAILLSAGCAVPKNYSNGQPRYSGSFDNKHRKDGPWKYFYMDGTKRCVGSYKSGRRDGAWAWFHPSGKVGRIVSFKSNLPMGEYAEYNKQGVLIAKGNFLRGKKNGVWEIHDATGRLMASIMYRDGKPSGECLFITRKEGGEIWRSKEYFAKGKRREAAVTTPEGKTLKFLIKRGKTVFPWKSGVEVELKDEFLTLRKNDMDKINAIFKKEDALLRDARRRFSGHYDFPRDPRPKR